MGFKEFIGLDVEYFVRNGFWVIASFVIANFSAFFVSVILANMVSKYSFGVFTFIVSLIGFMGLFLFPGVNLGVVHGSSKGYDKTFIKGVNLKWDAFVKNIPIIVVGGAILIYFINPDAFKYFVVGLFFIPLIHCFTPVHNFLVGKKLFNIDSVFKIIGELLLLAGLYLVFYFTGSLLLGLIVYFVIKSYPLIEYFFAKRYVSNDRVEEGFVEYSGKLNFFKILSVGISYVDKFIVTLCLGFASLAVYTIIFSFSKVVTSFFKLIESLLIPKIIFYSVKDFFVKFKKLFLPCLILVLIVNIIVWFLIPFVINTFFPSYTNYVFLSQLSIIPSVLVLFNSSFKALFVSKKMVKELNTVNIVKLVSMVVFLPLFILLFGLLGAIIGFGFIQLTIFVYSFFTIKNYRGVLM